MDNKIELKSIGELMDMKFFIPSYQRGYRWTKQQVKDLLDDIQEFIDKKKEGFYCIQPLVVKRSVPDEKIKDFKTGLEKIKNTTNEKALVVETEKLIFENTQWEVIDGQQRLTTIYILLRYLDPDKKYKIEYQTRKYRKNSESDESFLNDINSKQKKTNIDYYHIVKANQQIKAWFKNKDDGQKKKFLETLLKDIQFIWYESVDEDPVKVFTRLNIGKISLTNAELIKALFLNKSNFQGSNYRIRLQQNEIALEWDQIEYTLQNDEFWLFLHESGYDKPTRIDFIFDLISEKNLLRLIDEQKKDIGNDEYRTFRYFYSWFKSQKEVNIPGCWNEVKKIFQTFQEWFNDIKLFHYIGFLVVHGTTISDLLDKWNQPNITKEKFITEFIIPEIKNKLSNCIDLSKQYDVNGSPKTQCRPILLLHNIQTVINQNRTLIENEKYKLPVFYKFPFHLFKKEQWDVEHIDSHTENPLENPKDQKEWLKYSYEFIDNEAKMGTGENLKEEIKNFIHDKSQKDFSDLWEEIIEKTKSNNEKLKDSFIDKGGKNVSEKDMIWNFALLDSSTNRSYGNAIFPAKRRILVGKDQGKSISVDKDLNIIEENCAIAFIPPCTKNVFLKYYNPKTNNLREWDKSDAEAYLKNIESTLVNFLK